VGKADNLPPSSADVTESESLNLREPSGPRRPVVGKFYLTLLRVVIIINFHVSVSGITDNIHIPHSKSPNPMCHCDVSYYFNRFLFIRCYTLLNPIFNCAPTKSYNSAEPQTALNQSECCLNQRVLQCVRKVAVHL
jgi:hypothetical protein